ncbi:flagellar assembly peptidoglycan hydrolase FlgJ [Noviherbaspirillum cavernae]|uniref:Flagellar assembly peptidoglycan hydrolase FlgJ n=1 Tax=Noviherbaspirillum cavernae TaxID=2320862 RepID=A0A418WVH5_9BURK|nr:flagellar assembly peptidoglycan hydrolase FlgJ [Noviherbaspirillum cavernae]RJF96695.1 flagellar assembly peptidoglycan hydrolase FlgJ [Noviherbaspirillum cavernae]
MLRSDMSPLPTTATVATAATAPVRITPAFSAASGSNSFAATFGSVHADVMEFIENGSQNADLPSLSVEGQAYRASVQPDGAAVVGPEQQEFLSSIAPWAQEAGKRLGVSPDIVAAHAALESGWGRRPLRQADGGDTNNLFGLKAGGSWRGDVAQAMTTEYEDGSAVAKAERFRSYPDRASAFRDYAQLLLNNPRYHAALNAGGDAQAFAQGLAQGGYATDPAYAEKLARTATRIQSIQSGE